MRVRNVAHGDWPRVCVCVGGGGDDPQKLSHPLESHNDKSGCSKSNGIHRGSPIFGRWGLAHLYNRGRGKHFCSSSLISIPNMVPLRWTVWAYMGSRNIWLPIRGAAAGSPWDRCGQSHTKLSHSQIITVPTFCRSTLFQKTTPLPLINLVSVRF